MPVTRRVLLNSALVGTGLIGTGLMAVPPAAHADPAPVPATDPRMTDRAVGKDDAPVTVQEFFSLTCTHCAAFAKETFPQVKSQLIETNKLRYVFRDFPLDQVALTAAMVARVLPVERYEPFVLALLQTQDRWAFARGVNSTEELAKMAALAGMPRDVFDKTIADEGLKRAILAEQNDAQKRYSIDSTPTFVFDGAKSKAVKQAGEMDYAGFARFVTAAS